MTSVSDPNLTRIARSIVGARSVAAPATRTSVPRFTRGIVTGVNTGGTLQVQVDGTTTQVDHGTCTATSSTTLTDTSKTWTTNAYAGDVIAVGPTMGIIASNTGTVLTIGGWSNGTPVLGSTYIVKTAQILTCESLTSVAADVDVGSVVELHQFGTRVVVDGVLNTIKVGWQPLTLLDNWAYYGSGWQQAEYKWIGNRCEIRGLIANATDASQPICYLNPPPTAPILLASYCDYNGTEQAARLQLFSTGGSPGFLGVECAGGTHMEYLSINCYYYID